MKKITINDPCHENWAEFTPTQRGAFCAKCSIDVIDFSNKTPDEVKLILKDNMGKHLCGRFKKSQLNDLNADYYNWENQSTATFQSKFVYTLLIVFGMTLFSCDSEDELILGEVTTTQWKSQPNSVDLENIDNDEQKELIPGQVAPTDWKHNTEKPESEKQHIKGKIKYDPNSDTNCRPEEVIEYLKGEVAFYPEDTLYDDQMIDGGLTISPDFIEYIEDTVDHSTNENILPVETNPDKGTSPDAVIEIQPVFEALVYPNPASNLAKVIVDIKETADFNIYLYETDGKRTKTIYTGKLSEGRQIFKIDLTGYANGIYLVVINGGKQKESLKIQKTQ